MKKEIKTYNSSTEKNSAIRLLIIEAIILILIGSAVVLLLNYFNIISLGKYSNLFGVLPSQKEEIEQEMVNEELLNVGIETPDELPFAPCPFESTEICIKGKVIDKGESFYGIGYSEVPPGTEILSVMKGEVEVEVESGRNIITIDDGLGGQKATLDFIGEVNIPAGSENVEVGEAIGSIGTNNTEENVLVVSFQSAVNNEFLRPKISDNGSYVHNRLQ